MAGKNVGEKKRKKRPVAIRAALIGVVGAVVVAFIGVVANPLKKELPSRVVVTLEERRQVPLRSFLEISKPCVVSPDTDGTDWGYTEPPEIQVRVSSSNRVDEDALSGQCGKPRLYNGMSLPYIDKKDIDVRKRLGGRSLTGTFHSESHIRSINPRSPHGVYKTVFRVMDPRGADSRSSELEFNYVYKENFKTLDEVLTSHAPGFASMEGSYGGLEIRNYSKSGRYVSADLKQEFDFETDFCIRGFFTIEYDNDLDPSGFDIALCDRWGEKLSVVLGDGALNSFSIKMIGERYRAGRVTVHSERISIGRSTKVHAVNNYFLIRVWQHGAENRCSLYIRRDDADFPQWLCVHERIIDRRKFDGKFTRIKLKLWKSGILKLYDFEVAEKPSGGVF